MKTKNKKKKNNKQDDIKVVGQGFEEGYEDPKEAQLKEAKRRIEEAKKPFNLHNLNIMSMKGKTKN